MDLTQIILALIGLVSAVVLAYIGYLKIVVPEKAKLKAASNIQEIARLRAERDMWKEKAHANETEKELVQQKLLRMEMRHRVEMNEYISALDAIEMFNENPNTAKVITLLKSKLTSELTPART